MVRTQEGAAVTAKWWTGHALSFDTETTGIDPETDRIVSAHVARIHPLGVTVALERLVNPGVPIPPEATAVHGITDEIAATGFHPTEAIPAIDQAIQQGWLEGLPLIVCNAPYDLTLLDREIERCELKLRTLGPVLDPLAIDRACDKFRTGRRTLTALAAHYKVTQGEAHTAAGDALTAARIVWRQAQIYPQIRELTVDQMQDFQRSAYWEWARGFEAHLMAQGKPETISAAWPIR